MSASAIASGVPQSRNSCKCEKRGSFGRDAAMMKKIQLSRLTDQGKS
jgi:hypothetical protein